MTATAPTRTVAPGRPPQRIRLPVRLPRAFDLVALALPGMGAYVARRGSLPSDGLWFDDPWIAAGANFGQPWQLLAVGSGHPGFRAILMAVDRIGGGDLTHLGVPSLVFGVLAPPALYVALRSFGYARAISAIVSAALVVAPIPILYSGRGKGYTLDTLVVLLLAMAVPVRDQVVGMHEGMHENVGAGRWHRLTAHGRRSPKSRRGSRSASPGSRPR